MFAYSQIDHEHYSEHCRCQSMLKPLRITPRTSIDEDQIRLMKFGIPCRIPKGGNQPVKEISATTYTFARSLSGCRSHRPYFPRWLIAGAPARIHKWDERSHSLGSTCSWGRSSKLYYRNLSDIIPNEIRNNIEIMLM